MKQIKGFVSEILLEAFSEGRIEDVTLFRESIEGIGFPVTLSPVGQEEKPCTTGTQNPAPNIKYRVTDAYDSINEFKNDTEARVFIDRDGGLHPENYPFLVERVERMWEVVKTKHTPQAEPDEGCDPKPEGEG